MNFTIDCFKFQVFHINLSLNVANIWEHITQIFKPSCPFFTRLMSIRDNSGIIEVFFIFSTCDSNMSYIRDFIFNLLTRYLLDLWCWYFLERFDKLGYSWKKIQFQIFWIQNPYIGLYTSSFLFGDTLLVWGDSTLVKHLT